MEKYQGKSVFGGIAIGKIFFYKNMEEIPVKRTAKSLLEEIERYQKAKRQAKKELESLYEATRKKAGSDNAGIFQAQEMLLADEEYDAFVIETISQQNADAEYAVVTTGNHFAEKMSGMEDAYLKERAVDIKDVTKRIWRILSDGKEEGKLTEPSIVVARELTPGETASMDKEKMLALVTKLGSANSHTAILSKSMKLPALVGVEVKEEWNGKTAIVDGRTGEIYIEPDAALIKRYERRKQEEKKRQESYKALKGKENITLSGKKIALYANIGSAGDLEAALDEDAGGIGLLRSEFLYLGRKDCPTEEEQFSAYKRVVQAMEDRQVIIRTLDIGADKRVPYLGLEAEENPAMGYRGIRICLTQKELFKTQLRAILRAAAMGNVAVMYPMIISVSEMKQIKQIVEEVKEELSEEGAVFGTVRQGIMIETPAAALISDLLAEEVDFFSIGTNDLTQYTLAIDRQNNRLDSFYDAHHQALHRLIKMVADNANRAGIPVGICGELAADASWTRAFLDMGIASLSVSPAFVLPIRKIIRELD